MKRFTLVSASLLLQRVESKPRAICGQISAHYLLWWVRHTFPTDLTYFQLCLLFNNAFLIFFLPSCFSVLVSTSMLFQLLFSFAFKKVLLVFFFPLEWFFSPLCIWKKTNCESILTQIQKQFIWMCTVFENFWNLETNQCSSNTLYIFEKRADLVPSLAFLNSLVDLQLL